MHPVASPRKAVAQKRPDALAFAALIVSNIALAFGSWFVRLSDTGPVATGVWRLTIAAPILFAAAFGSGWRPSAVPRRVWPLIACVGLCFAGDLGCWHMGILRTTLANATLFGNSATLIYPIYGFLLARAWPSRTQALALVMAAAGAALLMGRSYQLDMRHLAGDLLCIAGGVLYSGYLIIMARLRGRLPPLAALALATGASILPMLGFALVLGDRIVPHDWGPPIALALVSQVLGQATLIYALGRISPLVVGIALLIQPIFAASVGWMMYDERLGWADSIGAVLVAIALLLVRRPAAGPAVVPDDAVAR